MSEDTVLSGIGRAIGSIVSFPIKNESWRKIAWAFKVIAQIIEIVLGAVLLGKDIIPNLLSLPDHLADPVGYKKAAYAYIAFFILEVFTDMIFWAFMVYKRGAKNTNVLASFLMSIFFDMPITMCGLYLMRAKGTVNWDEEKIDLLFQIWYIVNIMLQLTVDTSEKVFNLGTKFEIVPPYSYLIACLVGSFIVAPLSYLIACLLYAFVIIPMSGWHWFPSPSKYYNNRQHFVSGTFSSADSQNMLDFLLITGFIGQWIFTLCLIALICFFLYEYREEKRNQQTRRN